MTQNAVADDWVQIRSEEDALPFADKFVVFQTNLAAFGVSGHGEGKTQALTSLWSMTPDNAPENNKFLGFVTLDEGRPTMILMVDDELAHTHTMCDHDLTQEAIEAEADNPDNYNDGNAPYIHMRPANFFELTELADDSRAQCAVMEKYNLRLCETLNAH